MSTDPDLQTSAAKAAGPLIDPMDELQLALDVAAVPHHPLDERLHDYQRDAVAHLHAHPRAGLFLVPGRTWEEVQCHHESEQSKSRLRLG